MMYVTGEQCGEAYGDLEDELLATVLGGNGVENGRQLLTIELDCRYASVWVFKEATTTCGRRQWARRQWRLCSASWGEKVFSYHRRRHQ